MVTAIGEEAWRALCARSIRLTPDALRALSPMVILAPHPDDETLGCGGLLCEASALGLEPRVVYLTDGAASHPGSAMWPRSRLAQMRRQEALAALAALGVSPAQVKFLEWPDAAPFDPAGPEYGASLAELALWFEAFAPRSLWAPWRGEAHCDHEAASALADDLQRSHAPGLRRLDYLVWGWAEETLVRSHGAARVLRLPCAASTPQRRRALACHRTQRTDLIRDAKAAFLIPETVAALVDRPSEIFLEHA